MTNRRWLPAAFLVAGLVTPSVGYSAGFEIPENTTRSIARGGTGAISKRDPSALYFNPALLPRSNGFQALLDVNLVNLDVEFQRNDFVIEENDVRREYDLASNSEGFFPAPFIAFSHDFGIDDLGVGLGVFGPSAYGKRCMGEKVDGECRPDSNSSAKFMMQGSNVLEVYFTLGAGYTFHILDGELSVGLAGALAYQQVEFSLMVDEVSGPIPPWEEDPANQAPFTTQSLSDIKPTGFLGLVYDWNGLRVGASYRPPISWKTEGTFTLEEPPIIAEIAEVDGDQIALSLNQAGSLRTGIGYEHGQHPGEPDAPLFDVEFNFVWEDWSRLEHFLIEPEAQLLVGGAPAGTLQPVYQPKNYQDTYSFRLGGSWAPIAFLTGHLGASYESAAQTLEYTSADFISWERYTIGAGATIHPWPWLDVDLAYAHTFMPSRTVEDGEVYQPIPLSGCIGPDFDSAACAESGTPPGNPQNEGEWSGSFQILSVGATFKWDGLSAD